MEAYFQTAEGGRLLESRSKAKAWRRWGAYVAERAWGTVREDYSPDGNAWGFLTHDMARSKAYRWGEDAIAGWCDERQILCFGLALWNGRDAILKERLFGLGAEEGNHGEDVKECFYYVDATPTQSYMKFQYLYPQAAFPYQRLVEENGRRSRAEGEFELEDTGVFEGGRYFEITLEYAKSTPEEALIRVTATNRGPERAVLHLIPQLWFRNTWCWQGGEATEPVIEVAQEAGEAVALRAVEASLGERYLLAQGRPRLLFTDNESNNERLYGVASRRPHTKDAFHELLVNQRREAVSAEARGTKAGLVYEFALEAGAQAQLKLVLSDRLDEQVLGQYEAIFLRRQAEADEFYAAVQPRGLGEEARAVQRQALAGILWSKQYYYFDVHTWLRGDNAAAPPPAQRWVGRNHHWEDLYVEEILSMPDRWEYPWFAAWDLAFHAIALAMVDTDFAKQQLELLVGEKLMHRDGQIPAYEWQFSDVNPPVQAWAVWRIYNMDKHANGEEGDLAFLERCYHKLLMNFTWWVNRKDRGGRDIFEGGFLGLDNVSVFDRSKPLPGGGWLEQADGTGWMGLFCLNLMAIGLELAQRDRVYEHLGAKFFEHFMHISAAINQETPGGVNMWDEEDGWYYDVAHERSAGGDRAQALRVRSLVGLVPLFAAQVLEERWFDNLPHFRERYEWLLMNRPEFSGGLSCVWTPDGHRCLLSIVNYDRLRRILGRVLDEGEFLSAYGVRSLSRYHLEHPYELHCGGGADGGLTVRYEPGESESSLYGGNSNWRGPIWLPTTFMLTTALRVYDRFYGEGFEVECPSGSGRMMSLNEAAMEIARRTCSLFLSGADGRRPCCSEDGDFPGQRVLFHEYFHGESGKGLGAAHQTGWTSLVAKYLEQISRE